MSNILKLKKNNNISITTLDISPIKKEVFQSVFEKELEEDLPNKDNLDLLEKKLREEAIQKGYKEGFEKGYKEGFEEGKLKGYKEGFALGKEEAEKKVKEVEINLKKDFEEKIQSIERFFKNLEEKINNLVINMDKELLSLALDIANKLVLKEIETDPEIPIRIIKSALNYLAEGIELNIKVNPEDYKFLEKNLFKHISPSQKIKLIPEESISKGDVFIETSLGVIDATFEKRWKKLLETLLKDED